MECLGKMELFEEGACPFCGTSSETNGSKEIEFEEPMRRHRIKIAGDEIFLLDHPCEEDLFLVENQGCSCFHLWQLWHKATTRDLAGSLFMYFLGEEVREAFFLRAWRRGSQER